ncbi:hypothetical protein AAE478_008326 [Parahypoxylon ruwenzoriense]
MQGLTQPFLECESSIEHELLQNYSVSRNGFIPSREPLRRLSSPYYTPWESILDNLPLLIREKTIRRAIDNLQVLSTSKLLTEEEWRRAYVVLSFLTHAYIWGGEEASDILPPAISVPFLQISRHLDMPPVATYAALNLWNFKSTSSNFRGLDGLESLHTFSGTQDESWFFSVSVAMESEGAYIIPIMVQALKAIRHRDYSTIIKSLDEMAICIGKLGRLLDRMDEKCDPLVFYHKIRPYLAGSKNMSAAGLPNGVMYQDEDGVMNWKQLRGGSNGQSSLIQFLDIVLGVEHTSSGSGAYTGAVMPPKNSETTIGFHEEVRSYMPVPHRAFLQHVSRMDSLREFANKSAVSEEQRQLQRSFQAAAKALGDFRNRHMQIVTRYIIVPSRKKRSQDLPINLAADASSKSNRPSPGELTGTGGTALVPFLRRTRDETYRAGVLIPEV